MKKKVTLQDLSERLGLSTAAISKALRGHEGVSEQTRKLIFDTARAMNYKGTPEPKPEGKDVSGNVFILTDGRELTDPHTMSSYFYIEKALKMHGLEVSLHGIDVVNNDKSILAVIKAEQPLALFVFGRFSHKYVEEFHGTGKRVVVIDYNYTNMDFDSVMVNSYHGAMIAVRHLVHNGHRKLGFIGDNKLSPSFRARHNGFCDALEYWGLETNSDYIYDIRFMNGYGIINFNLLLQQLDFNNLPTAFFCANDPIAYVLNNILLSRGIKIPDDVSVVGFDNLDSSQWQFPPLTSLHFPREDVARAAVNLLLWRIANPDAPHHQIQVHPNLVVRQSVAAPRQS